MAAPLAARAVRPVPLRIITVSKGNSPGAAACAAEWAAKLARFAAVDEVVVKPNPARAQDPAAAAAAEGERVARAAGPRGRGRLVLLDERGRDARVEDFCRLIAAAGDDGVERLCFAIGGPHGHGPAARARADDVVRLSSLVLNHSVAHIVLLEQLYRGWSILRGSPYHHE